MSLSDVDACPDRLDHLADYLALVYHEARNVRPALRLCLSADQTLRYYILAFSDPQIVERCGSTGQRHDDCFRGTLDGRSFPGRPAGVRRDEPKAPRPCDPARSDSVMPKHLGD